MIVYRGVPHTSHMYAVIRTALRAHGFEMSGAVYQAALRDQWQRGFWFRDQALPQYLAGSVTMLDYRRIAADDPALWHQLPLMGALGYRHTRALLALLPSAPPVNDAAALLGAVFNTGIALFDYLVDESSVGTDLFHALTPAIVEGLLDPQSHAQAELSRAARHASDPRLRLLLGIVAAFGTLAQELVRSSGNPAAGNELARCVGALFEAERAVSRGPTSRQRAGDLLTALETKSALPSSTLMQIAWLGTRASRPLPPRANHAATALGHIFWRMDDVVDLLADWRTGTPSALLLKAEEQVTRRGGRTLSDSDLYDLVDVTAAEVVELLESDVFGSGRGSDQVDRALEQVRRFARETIAGWARWHDHADASAARVATRRMPGRSRTCADKAVAMLLGARQDGYREAVHRLRLPRGSVDRLHHELHPGSLFQRAVVLDSLLDARSAGLHVPEAIVDAEAMTLLRFKHPEARGGWSYLPTIPELPPDADDLGQVLRVLARIGGPALAFACDDAIRLALDAAGAQGGFPTWILEPHCRSSADRRMRAYLRVIGGAGVHPEVVANLLQGLLLYEPERYRVPILRAIGYLESMQDARGSWRSEWYAGPYYGTYQVAAVLQAVTPQSAALGRARRFLVEDQRPDGGWGEGEAAPLPSALALLALNAAGAGGEDAAIERGIRYLTVTQQADGRWPAHPWIQFKTLDGGETHGNQTITTAYALKALTTCVTRLATARGEREERAFVS